VDRDRLLLGLAAVFVGLTTVLAVGALASQPILLAVAVPFGATAYVLWYHATGRLEERARAEAEARAGARTRGTGAGPRGGARDPRSRFAGSTGRRPEGGRRRAETTAGAAPQSEPGPTRKEAFRTLGVDPGADDDAVRQAYRERVKDVHPDTERGDEEAFKRVNRAYERLVDE